MNINSKGHSGFRSAPALVILRFGRDVHVKNAPQAGNMQGEMPSLEQHFQLAAWVKADHYIAITKA